MIKSTGLSCNGFLVILFYQTKQEFSHLRPLTKQWAITTKTPDKEAKRCTAAEPEDAVTESMDESMDHGTTLLAVGHRRPWGVPAHGRGK